MCFVSFLFDLFLPLSAISNKLLSALRCRAIVLSSFTSINHTKQPKAIVESELSQLRDQNCSCVLSVFYFPTTKHTFDFVL